MQSRLPSRENQIPTMSGPGRVPRPEMIMQVRLHTEVTRDGPIAFCRELQDWEELALKERSNHAGHAWSMTQASQSRAMVLWTPHSSTSPCRSLTVTQEEPGLRRTPWLANYCCYAPLTPHPFQATGTEERVDAVKGFLHDVLDFLAASPNDCLEGASLELGTLLLK